MQWRLEALKPWSDKNWLAFLCAWLPKWQVTIQFTDVIKHSELRLLEGAFQISKATGKVEKRSNMVSHILGPKELCAPAQVAVTCML